MKFTKIFRILTLASLISVPAITIPATPALAAEVISLSAYQGSIGQVITINGSGFIPSTDTSSRGVNILFGKNNPGASVDYATDIYENVKIVEVDSEGTFRTTFLVPETLTGGTIDEAVTRGTYYVYLTYYFPTFTPPTSGTTVLTTIAFTVVAGEITISPDDGAVGTEVKINGTGFGNREDITIEYDGVTTNIEKGDNDTSSSGKFVDTVIIIPPSTAGEHTIAVSGVDSSAKATAKFTVKPSITVTPASGAAGTPITVTGTGFGDTVAVTISFGTEVAAQETTESNGSFSASFPALSMAAGSYRIVADDGVNSNEASFTITTTTITISPSSGEMGTTVNVIGSGFLAGRSIPITFNNVKVATTTSDANGNFNTGFAVPIPTPGTYKVKASDGINASEADFSLLITVTSDIIPKTSWASPGYIGEELTITGDGFTAGGTVRITYDGTQVAITTVTPERKFSATFKVPTSTSGEHTIIATDGTNSGQFVFVMESTPPTTPVPLKPEMNAKAEAETYFDWADVTDPNGVTYTLQIANRDDFSQSSIVMEQTGLTQSEYTIPREQRLQSVSKEAPYYWRVRATDGAGNESQWSGTGAFYVGTSFSLSQPWIYTLIGIGALLFAVFTFWLGRKTAYY